MASKFYITTAIPYVNAAPHIGHALEFVQTDTVARYHRALGDDTYFLSGTDENALKNVQAAEKSKLDVETFVDQNSTKFENLKNALNISFDDFIRTTQERHIRGAQKFWTACNPADIYRKAYKGLYCVGCEEFKTEKDLAEGKCPEHGTVPETVEEENYFFKLSKYQKNLIKLIESDELKITPNSRKNEVLSFIKGGLEDFSISRSKKRARDWGIPVPGDESQIIYVWFDALTNYLTGLGYAEDGKLFKKFWENNPNRVHVIGKGILRFHAVYWPAMLLSAKIPLPTEIFVHGYLTVEGQKISKTLGNVVDPFELVKRYGADPVRYYLLAKFSPYEDGDFSEVRLKETYNSDLANGLGNLVSRTAKMAEGCKIEKIKSLLKKGGRQTTLTEIGVKIDKFDFAGALETIWLKIAALDRWINKERTWEKPEDQKLEDLGKLIFGSGAVSGILDIAEAINPFLPETSNKVKDIFTGEIKAAKPLFPRLS